MNRRRKVGAHGLYYHSSPPKVFPNNEEFAKFQNDFNKNAATKSNALAIKPSNIRIWIHDKDIDKLMRVVLEGHGKKLRSEIASNPKVKRFLEYVPHFLGLIKNIHQSVVDNDIEILRAKSSPPVPPQMLNCKDENGLTPLHKAAGLAHTKIVEYLLTTWPNAAQEIDSSGKSPLHYAATIKNNERAFNLLVQAGCDELATDKKGHTAAFYKKNKNSDDINRSYLTTIPEAPRIAEQGFPPSFDWNFLPAKFYDTQMKSSYSDFNLSSNVTSNASNNMKSSKSAFEILSKPNDEVQEVKEPEVVSQVVEAIDRPKTFNKNDINNNNARKLSKEPEIEDDNDVENIATDEDATILSKDSLIEKPPYREMESPEHEYPSDPNETDQNVNFNEIDNEANEIDRLSVNDNHENLNDESNDVGNDDKEEEGIETAIDKENMDDEPSIDESQEMLNAKAIDMEEVLSQHSDEFTIVNNEHFDNNDSAYDTNEIISQNGTNSRLHSANTNEGDIDQETGENVDDGHEQILLIDDENILNTPEMSLEYEKIVKEQNDDADEEEQIIFGPENYAESLKNENIAMSPEDDDNNDVIVSAENPVETGQSTPINNTQIESKFPASEEQMEDDDDKESSHIGSPSPPYVGIITEEPEKQLESQGGEFDSNSGVSDENDLVQKVIESGDMEQLAMLVLNGDGKKLIGRHTSQPDIQAFIDNVPTYMSKIRKVHLAAREGSLRDLQAALDRRKFSTAKDEISPNGTSPLHVAVIFGHTAIIRYLGSRFQETLSATDEDNRTALHYAATIKDNGHFYNLLVHLGANPKATDNVGKTAESYLNHDESDKILSHKDLLKAFGAEETLADEMLNDQEFKNNQPVEIPLFRTEEGRYLATSLGDPLIKGLTEVANLRPADPIAFLANYLQNFSTDAKPKTSAPQVEADKKSDEPKLTENHIKPKSSKSNIPIKQKSIENLIDDDDTSDATPGSEERDEHGQSMLHFAAARQHGKNALFQLIEESNVSISYRDEIYRTARDVSLQASQPENCKEIDRYVLSLAAKGDYETFVSLLLDGYDHIADVTDNDGVSIERIAKARGHFELAEFLENLRDFEENREKLLHAVRHNDIRTVEEILSRPDGAKLARAKNYYGRCSLHIAVLLENEEIVEYIANYFRQTLRVGDNLERTALHFSMGINNVEAISRILIKNGAKRVLKDLKGRTASFYYINKSDILRLQEEERE